MAETFATRVEVTDTFTLKHHTNTRTHVNNNLLPWKHHMTSYVTSPSYTHNDIYRHQQERQLPLANTAYQPVADPEAGGTLGARAPHRAEKNGGQIYSGKL